MDIFDRLISLIPVILMILWAIRFIERIRRQRRTAQQTAKRGLTRGKTPAPKPGKLVRQSDTLLRAGEPNKLASKRGATFSKAKQMTKFANRAKRIASLDSLDSLLSPAEGMKSDKPDTLPGGKPVVVFDSPEQGVRVVEDRATSAEPPAIPTGRTSLDAIRARSPLAQAMLWKIIFDRPLALKGPDD